MRDGMTNPGLRLFLSRPGQSDLVNNIENGEILFDGAPGDAPPPEFV